MRLGIISDCIHFRDKEGRIGSTNHVYVMQMNALAARFESTLFCTPVVDVDPNTPALSYYTQSGIQFLPLPNAGGKRLLDKLHLLKMIPRWFSAFSRLGKQVDIIYQRFPNNLNIPGFFYVVLNKKPAFATYTGTWLGYKGESLTYKFQRWLLKNIYRGPVFVYDFSIKHPRIYPTTSPSYSLADWSAEEDTINKKLLAIENRGKETSIQLLSVGALTPYKNHLFLLKACVELKTRGQLFTLHIAGQGKLHSELLQFIEREGLSNQVHLLGVIPQAELREYYRKADFVVQPSIIEGYGKVPVEAMFHGAVPLLSPVSIHPFFVGNNNERGAIFELDNPLNIVNAIVTFTENHTAWKNAILVGRAYSRDFTLEAWTEHILLVLNKKGIYS